MRLLLGDCVEQMKILPENSVDAVVCDPPYELGFMGKHWDASGIAYSKEMWKEVLRVTKPGGHLLAFGGTRTYHRIACAIEDAGFEIRDQLQWLYGSGFPKSYNIGKGVDKLQGNKREPTGVLVNSQDMRDMGKKVKEVIGINKLSFNTVFNVDRKMVEITKGCSVWEGWGSALKPMNEPICLARKPLSEKNIVENCLKWGVGGLNIDESRILTSEILGRKEDMPCNNVYELGINKLKENRFIDNSTGKGRFPGNVLLDEEAAKMLDEQSGIRISGVSRFFYVAKASKTERNKGLEGFEEKKVSHDGRDKFIENPYQRHENVQQNHHPTVKPVKLMEYLVRLVTPKGGVVLDPFMGSGTTGVACRNLGFDFVGIEKETEYFDIAKARIGNQQKIKELLK